MSRKKLEVRSHFLAWSSAIVESGDKCGVGEAGQEEE
jgi:hypothetical protein